MPPSGYKHTEEAKQKISNSYKTRVKKGYPLTEEHRAKISKANTGRKKSDKEIERIRQLRIGTKHTEATKQKMYDSNHNKDLKLAEEVKKKISEAHKNKSFNEEHRKNLSVSKKGKPNKRLVSVNGVHYSTIVEAMKATGLTRGALSNRFKSKNYPNYFRVITY
jgi:hypothetical protein